MICLHALLPLSVFQLWVARCLTRFLRSTHFLRRDELALFFTGSQSMYQGEGEIVSADKGQLKPRTLQIKGTTHCLFWCTWQTDLSSRIKGRSMSLRSREPL